MRPRTLFDQPVDPPAPPGAPPGVSPVAPPPAGVSPASLARTLLAGLGRTGDDVAGLLAALNCAGYFGSEQCPVAVYLRRGGVVGPLEVCMNYVAVISDGHGRVAVPSPPGVRDFVRRYDAREFPGLIAKRRRVL